VLEVIYLVFNEGYAATSGERWTRPALCRDALRLGRILAAIMPREPEVHGLLALLELQASRLRARTGPDGRPVLLADQDRGRWDHLLVQRGLTALRHAEQLSGALGPYTLQAAIAACHARAPSIHETDWPRIAALYDALSALTGSPVVELNRAVAVAMAYGPQAGLEILDPLDAEPSLRALPPAAQRPRRPPRPARARGRGPVAVPPRGRAVRQRARARAAAVARRSLGRGPAAGSPVARARVDRARRR
jgi:RNA polymerase sigma-70 factor (ECF subfamily)